MEGSKIKQTIEAWFPGLPIEGSGTSGEYNALKTLAERFIRYMNSDSEIELEQAEKIGRIIHLLYVGENLYVRNAIENEFFLPISHQESPGTLNKHLSCFPHSTREGYMKVILENTHSVFRIDTENLTHK